MVFVAARLNGAVHRWLWRLGLWWRLWRKDGGHVAVMVHDGGSGGFGFGGDGDSGGHGKRMGILWSPTLQEIL